MSFASYYSQKSYHKIGAGRKSGILRLLGDYSGKKILDVGCGEGVLGAMLKEEKKVLIHGIDISDEEIEKAKKVLDEAYCVDIETVTAWPEKIREQKYDVIILTEVLEHILFPEKIVRRLKELSDKKTGVIITVPNVLFWKNRLSIFLGRFDYTEQGLMDRGHIHFFSWESLQKMLKDEGYTITETAHHFPTRFARPFARFFPGLFAYQFILKCRYVGNEM